MADSIPPTKLFEWRAYFDLVGTDAWRRTGEVVAKVHNVSCTKTSDHIQAEDAIPLLRPGAEDDDGVAAMRATINRLAGG